MKFDEGAQAERLSLNITPLIDVVFLLVLFFAVSSTFISTDELNALKDQVAAMTSQNTKLQHEIIDYRGKLIKDDEQIQRLSQATQRLESDKREIENRVATLAAFNQSIETDVARYRETLNTQAAEIERLHAMNRELESGTRENQDRLQTLTEVNASLKAESERYAEQVAAQSQSMSRLQNDYEHLQSAYRDLGKRLEQLTSQERVSQNKLEESASKMAEQAAVIKQLDNDYSNLRLNHARTLVAKQDEIEQIDFDLQLARTKIVQLEGVVSSLDQDKRALESRLVEKTEQNETLSKQLVVAFQTNQALKEEFVEISNKVLAKNETEQMLREKISQLQSELDRSRKLADFQSAQMERLRRAQLNLSSSLNRYLADKSIGLTREQNRLVLQLPDKVLFDSGSATVNPRGMEVLRKVGEILKSQMGQLTIQVGGHTDNVPVGAGRQSQFASNWDLSAARAVNVVRFLESQVGIDPSRMSAVGYGEHRPVASNETEAGRALNRRIEIVLLEP